MASSDIATIRAESELAEIQLLREVFNTKKCFPKENKYKRKPLCKEGIKPIIRHNLTKNQ